MNIKIPIKKRLFGISFEGYIYLKTYGSYGFRVIAELESSSGVKVENSIMSLKNKDIENEGVIVSGNTMGVKDELKKLRFRWDSSEKQWISYTAYIKEAMDLTEKLKILQDKNILEDIEDEKLLLEYLENKITVDDLINKLS